MDAMAGMEVKRRAANAIKEGMGGKSKDGSEQREKFK